MFRWRCECVHLCAVRGSKLSNRSEKKRDGMVGEVYPFSWLHLHPLLPTSCSPFSSFLLVSYPFHFFISFHAPQLQLLPFTTPSCRADKNATRERELGKEKREREEMKTLEDLYIASTMPPVCYWYRHMNQRVSCEGKRVRRLHKHTEQRKIKEAVSK